MSEVKGDVEEPLKLGNRALECHNNIVKESEQSALCVLDNERSPGVTYKCSHSQCCLCACATQAVYY